MKNSQPDLKHEKIWLDRIAGAEQLVDTATGQEADPGRGVFLAHAFSALVGEDGRIDPDSQNRVCSVLDALRVGGYGVHCSLDRENWGTKLMTPEGALKIDKDQLEKAAYLVSFPQRSPGAFMELGLWAADPRPTVLVRRPIDPDQHPGQAAEELVVIDSMVELLARLRIPHAVIDDASAGLAEFEATTVNSITAWIDQN